MATEIERKFLVIGDAWRAGASEGEPIRQGYLTQGSPVSVRVRLRAGRAFLTIKRERTARERAEFEYEIPLGDAQAMLAELSEGRLVEKTRYKVEHGGRIWEIDAFAGANAGLVLAEVELERAHAPLALPPWAGREVTDDPRFRSASLAERPFDPGWLGKEAG